MTRLMPVADVDVVRDEVKAEIEGHTVLSGFLDTVERLGEADSMLWKEGDEWKSLTWNQYRDAVREVALGLELIGFRPKEFALLMSRNRPEPHIADLAAQAAGGVATSMHTTLSPSQVAEIADNSQATVAFVENRELLAKFEEVRDRLPHLRTVVLLTGEVAPEEAGWLHTWESLRARGAELVPGRPDFFTEATTRLSSDDLATVVYTSGTTGAAKGVMLAHRNVRWSIAAGFREPDGSKPAEPEQGTLPTQNLKIISYLPLGTVGARMVDHWGHVIMGGAVINFCPDPAKLFQYLREVRPSLLMGVPAIFERLHSELNAAIDNDPQPGRTALVRRCLQVGRQLARFQARGEEVPEDLRGPAEQVRPVLRAILAKAGLDECLRAVSGGAPIDPEIIEFFQSLGLSMTQSWGMTELTTSVTSDGPNGSVGKPYPGVEIGLADDDEIIIRGGMVMQGYYRDPEATAEVLSPDGWFRTGDIGAYDEQGHLHIVGRKKELIINTAGTNIAPTKIEFLLQRHPLIGAACAIGDRRPHVTALLTLNADRVAEWAAERELSPELAELSRHPDLLAEIGEAVRKANGELAVSEQVRAFRVLPAVWSVDGGELTANFKKRRNPIAAKYAEVIEQLYGEGR
ncbi:AMP-dependent synthetase/ligase [Crossiella sp. CA198]|uniref:AMP-dependent synthetase/ligase n=1 Tax=Crossiella sp. CA198 TaxID=3455607 RepID=UPI003F8D463B